MYKTSSKIEKDLIQPIVTRVSLVLLTEQKTSRCIFSVTTWLNLFLLFPFPLLQPSIHLSPPLSLYQAFLSFRLVFCLRFSSPTLIRAGSDWLDELV